MFEGFEEDLGRSSEAGVAECDFTVRVQFIATGSQCRKLAQVRVDLLHDMFAKYASHSDSRRGVPLYAQQSALCDVIAIRIG